MGSILSGLFRRVWPVIQSGAKSFGKQFLKTGLQVANDVVEGQTFKESGMKRVPEGIKSYGRRAGLSGLFKHSAVREGSDHKGKQ